MEGNEYMAHGRNFDKSDAVNLVPKGEFSGECNRTACKTKNAQWFNKITQAYYCDRCARMINQSSNQSNQGDLCDFMEQEDLTP